MKLFCFVLFLFVLCFVFERGGGSKKLKIWTPTYNNTVNYYCLPLYLTSELNSNVFITMVSLKRANPNPRPRSIATRIE